MTMVRTTAPSPCLSPQWGGGTLETNASLRLSPHPLGERDRVRGLRLGLMEKHA